MVVQGVLSAACLVVGGYYVVTLIARGGGPGYGVTRWAGIGYDLSHLVMALGMAAMFSPVDVPIPRLVWLVVFGVAAAWFATGAVRHGLRGDATTHHLVANLAMLFMVAVPSLHTGPRSMDAGHEGHAEMVDGSELIGDTLGTVLTVLLAGYFAVHAVLSLRMLFAGRPGGAEPAPGKSTEPAAPGPVTVPPAPPGTARSRAEAVTHAVIGVAMAVMFGLMLW